MPRYAVIDNGVVVGVLGASTPPTIDVPLNRLFVDISELPEIKGGEIYNADLGMFSQPGQTLEARLSKVEQTLAIDAVQLSLPKV